MCFLSLPDYVPDLVLSLFRVLDRLLRHAHVRNHHDHDHGIQSRTVLRLDLPSMPHLALQLVAPL